MASDKIGIIGSGLIGRSWAMLFAGAGYNVSIFDVDQAKIPEALQDIRQQLNTLQEKDMLRGRLNASQQADLIRGVDSIDEALENAIYVQECVFEDVELKKRIFKELDEIVDNKTILASSTSCFPVSQFTEDLVHRSQCLVAHPVNPPYYVPLVEIVPAPWTNPQVTATTRVIQQRIGQCPVVLNKEVAGFALNRIQYAILNECWNLVEDGVLSVNDIDSVMSNGLGMRYAFLGPLETAHLNAQGTQEYFHKYAQGIIRVSSTFKGIPTYCKETIDKIEVCLSAKMPLNELGHWRKWRDTRLAALAKLKRDSDVADKTKPK
ncbi:lambda-crystallin-like [Tropilaelaps mercedesae]|uniref:Lambda-crystallin-like n=1 Tax=Tropilaelaps mercedesae TaxID=418985 RepID=A0A1V9X110_9ACAR|nr:lambda-crystallin-like [Tropilaelaps mercedesae]